MIESCEEFTQAISDELLLQNQTQGHNEFPSTQRKAFKTYITEQNGKEA